jgi:energy-coupling factor transporter ATP-binding protein EcfA2
MTTLVDRARSIADLADRRWSLLREHESTDVRDRARQLRDHVRTYILSRVTALEAPLLVVLLGPTGAGKSTLMNTIARAPVSAAGVLRPTTREAVLLATDADADALARGALAQIPKARLVRTRSATTRPGIAVVDAPDLDSVERANRAVADQLVEAADLCVFVTTAARYADQVPYSVLERIAARGLPLLIVVNRLPPERADQDVILTDIRRVLAAAPLRGVEDERLEVVGVPEGALADGETLDRSAVAPVIERIEALATDRERRVELARRALAGAIAGLGPLVERVTFDLERAAADAAALRGIVEKAYELELGALLEELRSGTFMRTEVLRHWESFVKADQITRFFSRGLGRLRGTILAAIKGTPEAPVGLVEREVTSDVVAVTVSRAAEAARRVADEWSTRPGASDQLARDPSLWSASPDLSDRLTPRLRDWVASIAMDVQARGAPKRDLAFGVSLGVNALGIAAMLGVFAHTAGVSGAEVGILAATGFLNQKLLQAIFGEAAMREMIANARARLNDLLRDEFACERSRYERLVAEASELRALAGELRAAVASIDE